MTTVLKQKHEVEYLERMLIAEKIPECSQLFIKNLCIFFESYTHIEKLTEKKYLVIPNTTYRDNAETRTLLALAESMSQKFTTQTVYINFTHTYYKFYIENINWYGGFRLSIYKVKSIKSSQAIYEELANKVLTVTFYSIQCIVFAFDKIKKAIPLNLGTLPFFMNKCEKELQEIFMIPFLNLILMANSIYLVLDAQDFYKPIPLSLEQLRAIKNKRMLFQLAYTQDVPKWITKTTVFQGQIYLLACRKIVPLEVNLFTNYFKTVLFLEKKAFSSLEAVFQHFYLNKLKINAESETDDFLFLRDYIKMVLESRKKSVVFNLKINSTKRLRLEHDKMAEIYTLSKLKGMKLVNFNLKKPFTTVIESLSSIESDRVKIKVIKNNKDLYVEGKIAHNCVASRERTIKRGTSLILSIDYHDIHHTAEIRCKQSKKVKRLYIYEIKAIYNQKAHVDLEILLSTYLKNLNDSF